MNRKFLAKSSSGNLPYEVQFIEKDGKTSIVCDCPAGNFSQLCKHKLKLLQGKISMLYNEDQAEDLLNITEELKQTGYFSLIIELSKAEQTVEEAKENLKNIKKKVGRLMSQGL